MDAGAEAFTPREGRSAPAIGDRVRVYRNLPLFKHRVFSIMAMSGPCKGLVLGYSRVVGLERVTFKVSEATRQKVIAKNCRTVHAFAEGYIASLSSTLPDSCQGEDVGKITYNPFLSGHFYDRSNPGNPVKTADEIYTWGADLLCLDQR
jgi:hypothetical protein